MLLFFQVAPVFDSHQRTVKTVAHLAARTTPDLIRRTFASCTHSMQNHIKLSSLCLQTSIFIKNYWSKYIFYYLKLKIPTKSNVKCLGFRTNYVNFI